MKLVMTLLVRDEDDVLEANLECHLAQGVDFFIVTDNLSVDGTRAIVERYVRARVAVCLDETADDYSQARWVTRMARLAATRYQADWVINSDADEFWIGSGAGGIQDDLASVDPHAPCVSVARTNYVPVEDAGAGGFSTRMTIRERQSVNAVGQPLPPKVCHRAAADIDVDQGNHGVRRGGVPLRSAASALRILHFPVRSYRQFENKIVKGGAAYARNTELPSDIGRTWRELYASWQSGGLRAHYQQLLRSPLAIARGLDTGELIHDATLPAILGRREGDPAGPRRQVVNGP